MIGLRWALILLGWPAVLLGTVGLFYGLGPIASLIGFLVMTTVVGYGMLVTQDRPSSTAPLNDSPARG